MAVAQQADPDAQSVSPCPEADDVPAGQAFHRNARRSLLTELSITRWESQIS
jgi:hypothetical protein